MPGASRARGGARASTVRLPFLRGPQPVDRRIARALRLRLTPASDTALGNAIAITSIVASAVVGISVALISVWAHHRRQLRQARTEQRRELREVLDLGGAATAAALTRSTVTA